jgi:DNA-binding XRE family transcriptional regulator
LIMKSDPLERGKVLISNDEAVMLGREVVADGRLKDLRERLGLTRFAMAEILQIAWPTYANWERRPVALRRETAARVGRFYKSAILELGVLQEHDVNISDMIPFHVVATVLGIPQEQLLYRYRNGEFEATDMGILGLWVHQSDLNELRS